MESPLLGVGAAARAAGRTRRAIHGAIRSGRLPAQRALSGGERFIYLIHPDDVARVWPTPKKSKAA